MEKNSEQGTVAQFCGDRYQNSGLVHMGEDDYGQYMHVKDPVVLAALVAFCSGNHHRVLLRGCCRNFPKSFPSLFRDQDSFCGDAEQRWSAYRCVLRKLKDLLSGTRWDRESLGAVLQHYGIKTPWLDVVRNLHTAIWFATHTLDIDDPSRRAVKRSMEEHGWISLYVNSRAGQRQLTVVDLWDAHSSQHVRLHAQQGLSLAMQCDTKNDEDHCPPAACTSDFNTHRVARIRFPAQSEHWRLCGHMFSSQFLFPAGEHDDSLKQLLDTAVLDILEEARIKHGLDQGTLGAVYTVGAD